MTDEQSAGLHWTGHPLPDMGIAAILAHAGKKMPAAITIEDLENFAESAIGWYFKKPISGYVTVLFTSNFLNNSWKREQREMYASAVLRAFQWPHDEALPHCSYCGRIAARIANLCGSCNCIHHEVACPSCGKEGKIRAYRDLVPLVTGRDVINFFPNGEHGLALCGLCVVALQALTVAAPRCSGRALVLQSDDVGLTAELVRAWVNINRKLLQLTNLGEVKVSNPRTRLVELLTIVQKEGVYRERNSGVVAYHLSNSGQGPGIAIYELPSNIVDFFRKARSARTATTWSAIERRGWQRANRNTSAADVTDDERLQYRNYLYDDLFTLPEQAGRFVRIYFLRNVAGLVRVDRKEDPRSEYQSFQEADLVNWELAQLFLQEVLSMEQARINAIRQVADNLAEEIVGDNNRRLFLNAYRARDYGTVRRLLLDSSFRRLTHNAAPTVSFSQFLTAFEEGEELARVDWRLAWDLVLIRLIERLYENAREVLEAAAKEALADAENEREGQPA